MYFIRICLFFFFPLDLDGFILSVPESRQNLYSPEMYCRSTIRCSKYQVLRSWLQVVQNLTVYSGNKKGGSKNLDKCALHFSLFFELC